MNAIQSTGKGRTAPGETEQRQAPALTARRIAFYAALVLLGASFALGGSSVLPAGRVMVLELLAVFTLAATLISWSGPAPSRFTLGVLCLVVALPLIQLIPLPVSVWTQLPGRGVQVSVGEMIGLDSAMPLSLDGNSTFRSWLSFVIPVALFLAVQQMRTEERTTVMAFVVAVALASILLGLMQMLVGEGAYLFESEHNGLPIGLFTNRNHQAALLYAAAVITIALSAQDGRSTLVRLCLLGVLATLVAGVLATQSRMGLVLIVVGALVATALAFGRFITLRRFLVAAGALGLAVLFLTQNSVVRTAVGRFVQSASDGRYDVWPDVGYAISFYWPYGSGIGTFVKAFQATESLTTLGPEYVNHAHNEYLEILLECGVAGVALIALFVVWLLSRAWSLWREGPSEPAAQLAWSSIIVLCMLMAHSIVDFPVRTYALFALFGLMCGMLIPPRSGRRGQQRLTPTPESNERKGHMRLVFPSRDSNA